jgi:His-Xaa-Ser system protein HxsD
MGPIVVEFGCAAQSESGLRAAAYRLIGIATCEINQISEQWVCRLTPVGKDVGDLKTHFLDLVTDENLRETIAARTEPTRNLIMALAFGHLAAA